jgi:uncharacterized membrane protein YgdD (TMEM256/DUF423 family)
MEGDHSRDSAGAEGEAMEKTWFIIGAALAFLGVAAGAFGAHGLREHLTADALNTYETASRYHLIHALALLAVAFAASRWGGGLTTAAGWLLVAGIVLFSGSLYLLAISGVRWLGAVAPFGGVAFLAGWACLVLAAWRGQ